MSLLCFNGKMPRSCLGIFNHHKSDILLLPHRHSGGRPAFALVTPSEAAAANREHRCYRTPETGGRGDQTARGPLLSPWRPGRPLRCHGSSSVSPAGPASSPPCPDAPPDQRLTAHPGPPAPVSGRGEWDYLHLQIHPWRPRSLAPALPPLPPLQQHPFRGAIGHHAPPHLSGVIGGEEVRRRSRGYLRGQGETVEFILDVHPDYRGLGITGLA